MLCDAMHTILPMNKTQRLIVEWVLHRVITTTVSNGVQKESQLLLYIRGEGGVCKSRVVKGIEQGFSLLSRRADLVLAAPTGAATSNIEGNIVHTCLGIGIRHNQGRSNKVSSIWTKRCTLIIIEVSMVMLDMLSNIVKQLAKAKGLSSESTAMFRGLPIVILIGGFYQFPPVIGQPLWEEVCTEEDPYGKML